jgi:triacylglycerol esterase/lipase EstA (alpha/beta hydrolase family)
VTRFRLFVLVLAMFSALAVAPPAQAAPSSGVNDWTCLPSAAHPRPVVLLHGLSSSNTANWAFHGPAIAKAGYCVFSLTYGVNSTSMLFGGGGFDPIDESAHEIGAFVDEVLETTGATKVDLVGHSEGAFQSLYVTKVAGYAPKIGRVVALAPPTHGTTFAGIVTLGQLLGGQALVNAFTDGAKCFACTDLIKGGPAVAALTDGPIAQAGVQYTVIASKVDFLVTPTSTAFVPEPGVNNYYIQSKCPLDPVGHIGIAVDTGVTSMILNGLDPTVPIRCGFGPPF